jgi:fumarate hydratase subunit beta
MLIQVFSPLSIQTVEELKVGNQVSISGVIYSARDAAHKRLIEALNKGEELPFDIVGQTLYYMGPSPAKLGQVIGAAGPTTSKRMDVYTPALLEIGLRAIIGKGSRSVEVKESLKKHKAIYFAATGGTGALISKSIKKAEIIAYEDLGVEAIRRLEVENFPAIVVSDIQGHDLYEEGKARYQSTATL